jgi:hypothetical protein
MDEKKKLAMTDLIDRMIVIDTRGTMIAIGRLVRIASDCLVLEDADVHDSQEGYSNKELYDINACKFGVRPNRQKVYIPKRNVIAISAIEDFITD